jgi:hypothetical protein
MHDSARKLDAARRALARTERELRTGALAKNTFAARWRLRGMRTEAKRLRRELIRANRETRHQRSTLRVNAAPQPAERRRKRLLLRASKAESAARKGLIDDAGRIVTTINARLREGKPRP